jgi:hypothetical protein
LDMFLIQHGWAQHNHSHGLIWNQALT